MPAMRSRYSLQSTADRRGDWGVGSCRDYNVSADHGKSVKLCIDKNTAGHLAEEDTAAQIGIQTASVNGGDGIGNDGI